MGTFVPGSQQRQLCRGHVASEPTLKGRVCCEGNALGRCAYVYGACDLVVPPVGGVLIVEIPLARGGDDCANVFDRVCHGVLSEGFADANVVSHCFEHDLLLDAVVLGESPHNVRQCICWYGLQDVVLRVDDALGITGIEAVLFHQNLR